MKYVWGVLVTPQSDTNEPSLYTSKKKAMAVFNEQIKDDRKMGLDDEVTTIGDTTACIVTQPKTKDQIFYSVKKIHVS